jgi:hypothetical protein
MANPNIIINNSFQHNVLGHYITNHFAPIDAMGASPMVGSDIFAAGQYETYDDAANGTTSTAYVPGTPGTPAVGATFAFCLMVSRSYVDLIHLFSSKSYDGTLSLTIGSNVYDLSKVLATLYCNDKTRRDSMVDLISANETSIFGSSQTLDYTKIKTITTHFNNLDLDGVDVSNGVNYPKYHITLGTGSAANADKYKFNYKRPLELNRSYLASRDNDTNTEDLYLIFPSVYNVNFASDISASNALPALSQSGTYTTVQHIWDNTNNVVKTVAGYIACKMATDNSGDLKFDYLDEIEYLDNFILNFTLPKTLS